MTASNEAVLALALQRFTLAESAESKQRTRELDDLNFEFDPWTTEAKEQRGQASVGNVTIPARPMISIPSIDQPIQLIENQQKAAHLGVQIHPEGEDATDATAVVLQDLYRDIETKSRANIGRDWAFKRAIRCGRGCYRVNKVYADETTDGPGVHDQKLVVTRILNQASVLLDCFAEQPDYSDMEWGFISSFYPTTKLLREFPKATSDYTSTEEFTALGDAAPKWYKSGEGTKIDSVRVTEYFCVEYSDETVSYGGKDRTRPKRKVTRYVMTGLEILDETEWDGQYIPIIPVIGQESNIDGERRWDGVTSKAKEPARLLNWGATTAVEALATSKTAPWVMAEGQQEGHENEIVASMTRNIPYFLYKPVNAFGTPAPPPVRNLQSVDLSGPLEMIKQGQDWVHTSTFAFAPTLGQPDSHRSGKAVLALQQQADQGTSNYLDNLAQISLTYEAMVILDLIPFVYDRPGRIVQIRGKDDKVSKVILNQAFVKGQQGQPPTPVQPGQPPQHGQLEPITYDLTKGRYAVTVSVGKSYQTRIQQGSDQLGQLIQSDPQQLMPILGWRWAKFQEWPGHEEASEDLKKMRPPQLQDEGDPQAAKQQLGQAMQMVDALTATVKQQHQIIETKQIEQAGKMQLAQVQGALDVQMSREKNETQLAIAELSSQFERLTLFLEERARLGAQEHETRLATADAGHEEYMAQLGHAQALQQGDQAAQAASGQSAQDHGQALQAGDMAHGQALEQQQQAADLAPKPEAGA